MSAPREQPPADRSLVHHRDFRRLWAGDGLGQLGAQMSVVVLPVLAVQHLHADAWQMGLLSAAETAAFLLLGLPAGAWVDRMRKKQVLVTSDLVRAGVLGLVVAGAGAGALSMDLLIGAALVVSVATLFFDVAHQSYVPGLVGLAHVREGNAKLQATASAAQVGTPALAGALLRAVAPAVLLGATAVTSLVSALLVSTIEKPEPRPDRAARRSLRAEVGEGLAFVVQHRVLRAVVTCTGLANLAGATATAVSALFALRVLGLSTSTWGVVLSAGAVGGLLGAMTSDRIARAVGEHRTIALGALVGGPALALTPLAATGLAPAPVLLVTGGALASFAVVVYNVVQVSFRQRLCPPRLLGRMNASVRFLVWGVMPLGGLLGGWLGTALGVVPTLWVAVGLMCLAAAPVLGLLRGRALD